MGRLSERQARRATRMLTAVGAAAPDPAVYALVGVRALSALVGADLTTLSVCALATGRRRVVSEPDGALPTAAIARFDQFFFDHPLVRFHSQNHDGGTHRISDALSRSAFERSPLYNEYYRFIGIEHAVAVPLYVDGDTLVSFVLNRADRDFDDDELALLEALRRPLATLYRRAVATVDAAAALREFVSHLRDGGAPAVAAAPGARAGAARMRGAIPGALTQREHAVLDWVASGKTDAQVAQILGISPRTVQKHLEHVYAKLGVESRTAAVMRFIRSAVPARDRRARA
jgi:DNA-binding CsgD family transcriptional regulator